MADEGEFFLELVEEVGVEVVVLAKGSECLLLIDVLIHN